MTEWQNTTCTYYGCPDRLYQKELGNQVQKLEQQKNGYFQQLQELNNILKDKDKTVKESIKSLLENTKVVDGKKQLKIEDATKKLVEQVDTLNVDEIIQKNIQKTTQLHEKEQYSKQLEQQISTLKAEVKTLKEEKQQREKEDKELIKEIDETQRKSEQLVKQKQELDMQVKMRSDTLERINKDIELAKQQIQEIQMKNDELKADSKRIRLEKRKKRNAGRKLKPFNKLYSRWQEANKAGNLLLKLKLQQKIMKKYNKMKPEMQDEAKPKYDEVMKNA